MKRYFLLILAFWNTLTLARPMVDRTIPPDALTELATTLDIPPSSDLIAETQKRWLRSPGLERWQMQEVSPSQKQFILDWSRSQGLFSSWKPISRHYDKALILGATTRAMQLRLDYLKDLWLEGVRFQEIIWLTGDRPLDPKIDTLTDHCKNESQAAHILWETTELPLEMRALPVTFIAVPMKQEGNDLKRPNTEDTIIAWLNTAPKPSSLLFVSDQPFCGYQFAVVKSCLPETFSFDLVGQGRDPSSHPAAAAITLDAIARWIYQEHLNQNHPCR